MYRKIEKLRKMASFIYVASLERCDCKEERLLLEYMDRYSTNEGMLSKILEHVNLTIPYH